MLHLMPSPARLPQLPLLLDDLGRPSCRKLGRALGVTERTVRRWGVVGDAPRPVMLALFWISRWGQSLLNSEVTHEADLYRGLVGALERERDQLLKQLAKLGQLGEFGSANDPSPRTPQGAPASRPVALAAATLLPDPTSPDWAKVQRQMQRLQRRLDRRRQRHDKERERHKAKERERRAARALRASSRRDARQRRAA